MDGIEGAAPPHVQGFRQIVIWPLQLMPTPSGRAPWESLLADDGAGRWRELEDDFPQDSALYQERHYREFVAFLPHVQRFLYGERASRSGRSTYGDSPIRIFRRDDVAAVRVTPTRGAEPLTLCVVHVDLYFFYDVDVTILVVEIEGSDLPLATVQCVGRLDQDTTGLLLLSDDGQFIHQWSSGKKRTPKVYEVTLKHAVGEDFVAQLLAGVELHDEPAPIAAAACELTSETTLRLTICEGKYHQVKRMIAAAGNRVEALHRSRVGGLSLDPALAPGEWRWLEAADLQTLADYA